MLKELFKKDKANINVVILMAGTVISQLVPILVSPILTRYFTPEDFGLFGLYFSISMVLSIPVTGRYEFAIMLPKEDEDAINILSLSALIAFVFSFLLFVVLYFFHVPILSLINSESIGNWYLLLAPTVLLIGLYQSLNYWFNRKGDYLNLTYSRVARTSNSSLFSLIFGFTKMVGNGLILADTIGQAIATGFFYYRFLKKYNHFRQQISWTKMKEMAKRYVHFPKYNILSGFLQNASVYAPSILLTSFFGNTVVGFYVLSFRVVSAPGAVIARAFGDVFRQQATEEFNKSGNCKNVFIKTFKKLLILSVIPFILLFFFAPMAFEFIFGSEWRQAGIYTQIMLLMFFLQFTVSPLSNMFIIAEKQGQEMYLQVFLFISVLISFYIGFKIFNSVNACLYLFTFVYSIKYLIEFYLSYKFSLGKK